MIFKRQIGTFSLLLIAISGIIGSGWLFGSFFAAKLAGPSAIIAWIIGGVMMMVVALTFAELASTFPFCGAPVRFLQISHGPFTGFGMAWISWISSLVVAPVETLALIHYASSYFPGMLHNVNGQYVLTSLGFLIAAILMLLLSIINSLGVGKLTKANTAITLIKIVVPVLTIVTIFFTDFRPHNFVMAGFAIGGLKAILSAIPSAGIIFSYIGYNYAIMLAGEAKNPHRSLPIAIIGALIICIIVYTLLQVVFIGALPASSFQSGWTQLNFANDVGPFAGIAIGVGLIWLARVLYADAVISPYGTALVSTGGTARLLYAMSENGYVPTFFLKLNRFRVPGRIIAINYVIGLLLFLPFPTWQKLMSFFVSATVFSFAVGPLALITLRKTLPNQERRFRLPFAKITCFLAFYICNLIIYWASWEVVSKMFIAILVGYVLLLCFYWKKSIVHFELKKSWWIFVYMIALALISYLGAFGGRNVITFGIDFVVVALVSLIIYILAFNLGLSTPKVLYELRRSRESQGASPMDGNSG